MLCRSLLRGLRRGVRRSSRMSWSGRSVRWFSQQEEPRESMEVDVCIVGGGPAGLSAAIRLKQLAKERDTDVSVVVLEKGAEVGSHVLSGNVFEPTYLDELIPDWKEQGAPLTTPVTHDNFFVLGEDGLAVPLPVPPSLHNEGNYIISLGDLTRWLGEQAESLEVDVFPGFPASELLYADDGSVRGVATGDMGIGKDGEPTGNFARGMELHAKHTLLAEGARGSLSLEAINKFGLSEHAQDEQSYGIGLKEVWEVPEHFAKPGTVMHSIGFPLTQQGDVKGPVYGGGFVYHMEPNKVLLGLVVGLDYGNPYINPYREFQQWKTHPAVAEHLEGGKCVGYGARVINEGGYHAIPKLTFPGGSLIGCSAGFVNIAKIKGSHNAIKSGATAAEALADELFSDDGMDSGAELVGYQQAMESGPVFAELEQMSEVRSAFRQMVTSGGTAALFPWLLYSGITSFVGKRFLQKMEPNRKHDCDFTQPASNHQAPVYEKPDGELTFDLLTNLQRSGTYHEENQPAHLKVKPMQEEDPRRSVEQYAGLENRFCPAGVYEYVPNADTGEKELVINAQNCIHCKTCSIKSTDEFIEWTTPEGGGGPNYESM